MRSGAMVINPGDKALQFAELVTERISQLPWPMVAFLCLKKSGPLTVETYRSTDPTCDRLRLSKKAVEVGTYTSRAKVLDIRDDVLEALKRLS